MRGGCLSGVSFNPIKGSMFSKALIFTLISQYWFVPGTVLQLFAIYCVVFTLNVHTLAEPSEPVVTFEDQRSKSPSEDRAPSPATPPRAKPESKQSTPEPKASSKAAESKPKTDKEREMDEYKAKLAEKRRMAREKAEREAEIERIKQEELQ